MPHHIPQARHFVGLPDEPEALVRLADQILTPRPRDPVAIDRAVAALQKSLLYYPELFEVYWRLARAHFLLADCLEDRRAVMSQAAEGLDYAQQAARLRPPRVEGHYYEALNLAKMAEASQKRALIKPLVDAGHRARDIDERYDQGGPLVLLGKVYLTAPAWPVSVGNTEKAVELLERAVTISPRSLTRIFLGQAYFHDEQYDKAEAELRRALRHARGGELEARWRKEAEEYLRRIKDERDGT